MDYQELHVALPLVHENAEEDVLVVAWNHGESEHQMNDPIAGDEVGEISEPGYLFNSSFEGCKASQYFYGQISSGDLEGEYQGEGDPWEREVVFYFLEN